MVLDELCMLENAFLENCTRFEFEKSENTLCFPLFRKNAMFFCFAILVKSVKNDRDFPQTLIWRMVEIASILFGRLYSRKIGVQ